MKCYQGKTFGVGSSPLDQEGLTDSGPNGHTCQSRLNPWSNLCSLRSLNQLSIL